jgi:hypothetical protein
MSFSSISSHIYMFNPHYGRSSLQVYAFKICLFLLLNVLELGPPNQPRFIPLSRLDFLNN